MKTRHSKKRVSGYIKPKKKRCKHYDVIDSKGDMACMYCGRKAPKPKPKIRDPKDKVRTAAHTQKRRPPPKRMH